MLVGKKRAYVSSRKKRALCSGKRALAKTWGAWPPLGPPPGSYAPARDYCNMFSPPTPNKENNSGKNTYHFSTVDLLCLVLLEDVLVH
jgi:hypothetical protein